MESGHLKYLDVWKIGPKLDQRSGKKICCLLFCEFGLVLLLHSRESKRIQNLYTVRNHDALIVCM